jgi:hypothetical protein
MIGFVVPAGTKIFGGSARVSDLATPARSNVTLTPISPQRWSGQKCSAAFPSTWFLYAFGTTLVTWFGSAIPPGLIERAVPQDRASRDARPPAAGKRTGEGPGASLSLAAAGPCANGRDLNRDAWQDVRRQRLAAFGA